MGMLRISDADRLQARPSFTSDNHERWGWTKMLLPCDPVIWACCALIMLMPRACRHNLYMPNRVHY